MRSWREATWMKNKVKKDVDEDSTVCQWKRCGQITLLRWLGLPLCASHWSTVCQLSAVSRSRPAGVSGSSVEE